ncbi:DUF3365 domain-containing protein [Waterburya agarophytonicola K14]|uniref:DUF3365 domain-containing protein n=1 Tax=Waterburya agarophytonicola KI4 TaxID=2874699 RepID=A0A964FE64_9CYAN|nr:DUF3365 domain-containing protein [Waterburya agarophytonicola]MCC0176320.1 DUF3365 domain-containing protein [Waterburya agarophytonicola KI4]
MTKNIKLGIKLNILLAIIFLSITLAISFILSRILENYAEEIVADKASLLIETMNSVRQYTSSQIQPELSSRLETEQFFLPQTVPAYSAREIFENLRSNEKYSQFFYKEATLNPTNLRDKADKFETEIVESFRRDVGSREGKMADFQKYGFRTIPGGELFYIARPLAVNKESCLRCHSLPEKAPPSQIATYGKDTGFGWKLNEIVGAQIISVPASEVVRQARDLRWLVIGRVLIFLVLGIIILNIFLKLTITDPINKMSSFSKNLSTGDFSVEFQHESNDEIGILARSLNRLKVSLKMAMEMIENKPPKS